MKKVISLSLIFVFQITFLSILSHSDVTPDFEFSETQVLPMKSCSISNNENFMAIAGQRIIILEINTQKIVFYSNNPFTEVSAIAVNDDGSKLIIGCKDSSIIVWDSINNKEVGRCKGYINNQRTFPIETIAISHNNQFFVTGEEEGYVQGWDIVNLKELFKSNYPFPLNLEISKNDLYILVTGFDSFHYFDRNNVSMQKELPGRGATFCEDGKSIYIIKYNYLEKIDILTAQTTRISNFLKQVSFVTKVSSNGKYAISGNHDYSSYFVSDLDKDKFIISQEPAISFKGMKFSPNYKYCYAIQENKVLLWKIQKFLSWVKQSNSVK